MIRPRFPFTSNAVNHGRQTSSYATSIVLVCSLLSSAGCKILYEIIDDSDSRISYTGVGWTEGRTFPCPQGEYCPFTIQTDQVHQGTWHDNTGIDNVNLSDVILGFNNASLSFKGTAVYVNTIDPGFKLLPLGTPNRQMGVVMVLFIDGVEVDRYQDIPPNAYGGDGWQYNGTVLRSTGLENIDHELVVQSGLARVSDSTQTQQTTILLDYFIVCSDDGEPEPSSTVVEEGTTSASDFETPSTSSTPESAEGSQRSGTNTVLIVAPIVSILVVLVLIVAGIMIYMKRRGLGWSDWLSGRGFSSLGSSSSRSTQSNNVQMMGSSQRSVQSRSSSDNRRFTVPFSDFGTDSNADAYTEYAGTVPPPAYDEGYFDLSLDESAGRSTSGRGGSNECN